MSLPTKVVVKWFLVPTFFNLNQPLLPTGLYLFFYLFLGSHRRPSDWERSTHDHSPPTPGPAWVWVIKILGGTLLLVKIHKFTISLVAVPASWVLKGKKRGQDILGGGPNSLKKSSLYTTHCISFLKRAWSDPKNHPPLTLIKILVSIESPYFSDYWSEISGPKYVSFRCYEQKRANTPQSSHSFQWDRILHIFAVLMSTRAMSLKLFGRWDSIYSRNNTWKNLNMYL